jgi:hypothetical protein
MFVRKQRSISSVRYFFILAFSAVGTKTQRSHSWMSSFLALERPLDTQQIMKHCLRAIRRGVAQTTDVLGHQVCNRHIARV